MDNSFYGIVSDLTEIIFVDLHNAPFTPLIKEPHQPDKGCLVFAPSG